MITLMASVALAMSLENAIPAQEPQEYRTVAQLVIENGRRRPDRLVRVAVDILPSEPGIRTVSTPYFAFTSAIRSGRRHPDGYGLIGGDDGWSPEGSLEKARFVTKSVVMSGRRFPDRLVLSENAAE